MNKTFCIFFQPLLLVKSAVQCFSLINKEVAGLFTVEERFKHFSPSTWRGVAPSSSNLDSIRVPTTRVAIFWGDTV